LLNQDAISNRDQLASSIIQHFFESRLKRKKIEATRKTQERYKTAIHLLLGFLGAKARQERHHLDDIILPRKMFVPPTL